MKNVKMMLAFLLTLVMVLSLAACGSKEKPTDDELNPTDEIQQTSGDELAAPVITSVKEENGTAVISWEAVANATSYQVFRRVPGGDWELLKAVAKNVFTYTDDTLDDETYEYGVRAADNTSGEIVTSAFSKAVAFKLGGLDMPAPEITSATISGSAVTIEWSPVNGVTSYRVFRRTVGGDWTLLQAVARNVTTFTDAEGSADYQYAVRAADTNTDPTTLSPYSTAVSAN